MIAFDVIDQQLRHLREALVVLALELCDRAAATGEPRDRDLAAQASRIVDRATILGDTLDELRRDN